MRPPPRLHLKTQPTALKKLGPVDIPTFSTESTLSGHWLGLRRRLGGPRDSVQAAYAFALSATSIDRKISSEISFTAPGECVRKSVLVLSLSPMDLIVSKY